MPRGIYQRIKGVNCGYGINCGKEKFPQSGFQERHPFYGDLTKLNYFQKGHPKFGKGTLGKHLPPAWNKGNHSCLNTGRTHFKKGEHISSMTEFKKGNIPWSKGKKGVWEHSKEWKEKQRERMLGNKWNIGGKHSEETKGKIGFANSGSKSYLWQGGKSFEHYTIDWTRALRRRIRKRDNYTC